MGTVLERVERTPPLRMKRRNIYNYIHETYDKEESAFTDEVLSYVLTEFNPQAFTQYKRQQRRVMMRDAVVLRRDWLKYAESIAESAFEETDNTCVYRQLTEYLLNPPNGNPTKFIKFTNGVAKSIRVSENGLFEYFKTLFTLNRLNPEDYGEFTMQSGVSTEMLECLAYDVGRSLYAFDRDTRMFSTVSKPNKHYSPIVYYQIDGHMLLLNDPNVFRSISSYARECKKLISDISYEHTVKEDKSDLPIYFDDWNIETAKTCDSGIYIITTKSNLHDEVMQYINKYHAEPNIRTDNGSIKRFSYKFQRNKEKIYVCVCVDANYGKQIDYDTLKTIATENNIRYTNEGIGSVVLNLLQPLNGGTVSPLTPQPEDGAVEEDEPDEPDETVEEKRKIIPTPYSSSFNTITKREIFESFQCKSFQFVERIQENPQEEVDDHEYVLETTYATPQNILSHFGVEAYTTSIQQPIKKMVDAETFKIDMVKCRRNVMYNNTYEYPVYSVMDFPKDFSGEIECGMYYVITESGIPFRGSGWYLQPTIEYGLKHGHIQLTDIKLEFIPSRKISGDYFKKHIDLLLDKFSIEPTIQKLAVNAFIGTMGRTKKTFTKTQFKKCPFEASAEADDPNVFIKSHKLDNDEIIYEVIHTHEATCDKTEYLIYKMVLELEAIELHTLEKEIEKQGGIPLDRNTDAIRYYSKRPIVITDVWKNGCSKYQPEEPKPLMVEHLPNMIRKPLPNLQDIFKMNWTIIEDEMTDFESMKKQAKEIIDRNISINIDGRAGCGKTALVNFIREELTTREINYAGFSPTNKGARLIGGETIQRLFNKFSESPKALCNKVADLKYIFIDEVSMMHEKFYKLFVIIKTIAPQIRFIISGDYGQLPPVKDEWSGDYEHSAGLYDLCGGNKLILTKCRRADDLLFNICKTLNTERLRNKPKRHTYLNIAYTHETRIRVNRECMLRYIKQYKPKTITIPKFESNPHTQEIQLGVNMPLVCYKTNKKLNVMNSEKFTVQKITEDTVVIKHNEVERIIPLNILNRHFYLGFCITIYASQGDTFIEPYTIYDWAFPYMGKQAKYVALSRARDLDLIHIVA
jgi:hypothetical protein